MSVLLIDPRISGAAGDLLIAALLDIQTKDFRDKYCTKFNQLLVQYDQNFQVTWSTINREGFIGTQIQTSSTKKFSSNELRNIIDSLGKKLEFTSKAMEFSSKAISFLIDAEIKVHGYNNQSKHIHFHELATIDTVFDILGFVFLLEKMNLLQIEKKILPIAVGAGMIKIHHGKTSVPAPAALEIIRQGNLLIVGGPVSGELLTPTGAALLASLNADAIQHFPLMHIQKIGRGFGTRIFEEGIINHLLIIQGSSPSSLEKEEIIVLETNVDDVDGETLGHLFDILYEGDSVLDLTLISTISKKNRPGFLVRSIVKPEKTLDVVNIISRELGTLGVRVFPGFRHIIPRKLKNYQIKLKNGQETIQYKKGFLGSEIISEKIEFDDLQRLARKEGITLREMRKRLLSEISKQDDDNA
ncbi:MAG: nickel pincer cofactor biosynthesis protein LarC [Candidatus Hodarchaeota archaeon]